MVGTAIRWITTPAGDSAWFVSNYEDVKALMSDPRLGRSHPEPKRAARVSESAILGGHLLRWSSDAGHRLETARSQAGLAHLWEYMRALVNRKQADPDDDVIHDGRNRPRDGPALTHPEQADALRHDPALIVPAVEKILRGSGRVAAGTRRADWWEPGRSARDVVMAVTWTGRPQGVRRPGRGGVLGVGPAEVGGWPCHQPVPMPHRW